MDSLLGLLGYVGVIFLLIGYFMLVIGNLKVTDTHYIVLNILGSVFIVVTLNTGGVLPIFHTIVVWLMISLFGFYKHKITTH